MIFKSTMVKPKTRDALLYDSHPDHEPDRASLYYQRRVVDFNGRKWLIVLSSLHGNSPYIYFPVWATLVIGLTLSLAVFWLAIVTIARANALSVRAPDRPAETKANNCCERVSFAGSLRSRVVVTLYGICCCRKTRSILRTISGRSLVTVAGRVVDDLRSAHEADFAGTTRGGDR